MSFLQKLLDSPEIYDTEIRGFNVNPQNFYSSRDKFVFLAEKAASMYKNGELDNFPDFEYYLVQEPGFRKAANNCNSLYEMAVHIIKNFRDRKTVSFGQNQIKIFEKEPIDQTVYVNDVFTVTTSKVSQNKDSLDSLDSKNHGNHGNHELHNFESDEYNDQIQKNMNECNFSSNIPFKHPNNTNFKSDEYLILDLFLNTGEVKYVNEETSDGYLLFYLYPNGNIEEVENILISTDHSKSFIFAFSRPDFYDNFESEYFDENVDQFYRYIHKLISDSKNLSQVTPINDYLKVFPLKHIIEGEYLDIDLYINRGLIKYLTDEDYYDMEHDDMKGFFYLLPDGSFVSKSDGDYGGYEELHNAYLFVYPLFGYEDNQLHYNHENLRDQYYKSIKDRMDLFVSQFSSGAL